MVAQPPTGAECGVRDGDTIDALRLSLWSWRSGWRWPPVAVGVGVWLAIVVVLAVLDRWVAAGAALAGVPVVAVSATTALVVLVSHQPGARLYADPAGNAALLLVSLGTADGPVWNLVGHAVRRVGRGQGAAFRRRLGPHLAAAADRAGVQIIGHATNPRVRDLYLRQFADLGMTAAGPSRLSRAPTALPRHERGRA